MPKNNTQNPLEAAGSINLNRRSMIKAAAWATPVVAAAVAVPMAAASVTLANSGSVAMAYDSATGVISAGPSSFGITGTGTAGANVSTGPITVTIFHPTEYVPQLTVGQSVGNGWIVSALEDDGVEGTVLLTYAAGLSLSAPGTVLAPSFDTVVFHGPAGTPARRSFSIEDSWANYPTWGTASTWPRN